MSRSRPRYAEREGDSAKAWRYGVVQLACFLISCTALTGYAFRLISTGTELMVEVALLGVRALNELSAGKSDWTDLLHHSSTAVGLWLLASGRFEQLTPFGKL